MAELAAREPLLSNGGVGHGYSKSRPFLLCLAQWVLKSLMWLLFIIWVAVIFFFPAEFEKNLFSKWTKMTRESVFGITGSIFLTFSAPILIIAFLSFFYVAAFSRDYFEKKNQKSPRYRLWTFPILVDGPFGVVSAAELIGILIFTVYVLWAITAYTIQNYRLTSRFSLFPKEQSYLMLELTGLRLGSIGLFCLGFLFLPVARGSILLRLIDIPFEHATRYHVWLGHLTMAIFTLHGIFYVISWALQGCLQEKQWDPDLVEAKYLKDINDNLSIIRLRFGDASKSLFKNREFIVYERRETMDDGTLVVAVASLPKEIAAGLQPKQNNSIRGLLLQSGWVVEKLEDDSCMVTYVIQLDPAGWLPKCFVNKVNTKLVMIIDKLKKSAQACP